MFNLVGLLFSYWILLPPTAFLISLRMQQRTYHTAPVAKKWICEADGDVSTCALFVGEGQADRGNKR